MSVFKPGIAYQEDDLDIAMAKYQRHESESEAYLFARIDENFPHGSDARNWLLSNSDYFMDMERFINQFKEVVNP